MSVCWEKATYFSFPSKKICAIWTWVGEIQVLLCQLLTETCTANKAEEPELFIDTKG